MMNFTRTSKSSQVHSIAYDPVEQIMEAKFACRPCNASGNEGKCEKCSGTGVSGHYRYDGVPAAIYGAVRDADSIGAALNSHVKRGGYPFKRLD